MMKSKKRKLCLLLLATMLVNIPNNVNAAEFGIGYAATGQGSTPTPGEKTYYTAAMDKEDTYYYTKSYTCVYDYTYWTNKVITINGYDIYGNSLMENSINISKKNAILAGTSIGLNLYETKTISYKAKVMEVQELKEYKLRKYSCTYKLKTPAQTIPVQNTNSSTNVTHTRYNVINENNIQTVAAKTKVTYHWLAYGTNKTYCENHNPDPELYEYLTHSRKPLSNEVRPHTDSNGAKPSNNAAYLKECEKIAVEKAISKTGWTFYASYNIKMTDSNDVNGTNMVKITKDDAAKTIQCKKGNKNIACTAGKPAFVYGEGSMTADGWVKDSITATFTYKKDKTCINTKNSKVTYRSTDCEADELEVPKKTHNNKEYWNYFIPLNAKSDSRVEINMLPATGGGLSEGECNYVMQHNPVLVDSAGNIVEETLTGQLAMTYLNLINPSEDSGNTTFEGDYCRKNIETGVVTCNDSAVSSDYTKITRPLQSDEHACYLTSKIKIPTNQKFYNEVGVTSENVKFNGFNFYYKPIDVSDAEANNQIDIIFPNGVKKNILGALTTTTLWEQWYKAQTNAGASEQDKAPDLSNSYSTITYIAQNIDANKVRNYKNAKNCGENNNEKCIYTEWGNMNADGTSGFIETEGIIQRGSNLEFYKLGCGPLNIDKKLKDGTDNPLYIEGCGS